MSVSKGILHNGGGLDPKEHYYCGKVYLESNEPENAKNEFQKALDVDPDNPSILIGMGRAFLSCRSYDEAIIIFEKALRLEPDFADGHYYLGKAYLERDVKEKAINEFKEALNINPRYEAAKRELNNLLASANRPPKRKERKKAREMAEDQRVSRQANVHFHVGNAFFQRDMLKEAQAEYEEALRLRPHYPDIRNRLGEAHLKQERHELAEKEFLHSLKINPRYLTAWLNLAETHRRHGELLLEKAEKDYEKALDLDQSNTQAARGLERLRAFKNIDYV